MKSPRVLAVLTLFLTTPVMGVNVTFEKVTKTGEAVPGREHLNVVFNGRTFQTNQNPGVFSRPSINESGEVVFMGRSSAPHDFNINAAIGIYSKSPLAPLIVLADTSEQSPGVPTFPVPDRPAGTRFTSFGQPMLNNQGHVIFRAGFGGTGGSGSGIYAATTSGGSLVKIVDTFDEVPGFPGTTFNSFFFSGFRPDEVYSLNDAGQVVFIGRFFRSGQSFEDNGLYGTTVAGGSLVRLVDTAGTTFGASETTPFRSLSQTAFPALNQQGTVLFQASIGSTPSFVQSGIFSIPVDGSALAETHARRPLVSPPLSDGIARNYFALWAGQDLNDSGDYLFQHTFFGSTNPPQGLFTGSVSGSSVSLVADNLPGGFSVPGQPSGTNFTIIGAAAINNEGAFGFFARDNGPVSNAQGVYAADIFGSPFRLVAHLGTVPPGHSAPARFTDFEGRSASINDLGNMVIAPRAADASNTALRGLYFFDNCTSGLERIVDSATSAPAPPDGLGNVFISGETGLFIYDGREVRAGHFKSLNNNNQVAFMAAFETFNVGIYIANVQPTGGGSQLDITCPPDVVVECGDDTGPGGVASAASAFNNCSGESVAATFSDSSTAGACGATEAITRTWTGDDGSGSPVSCDQAISVVDTTDPVISGVPAGVSVECDAVPDPATPSAVDACGDVSLELTETQVDGSCPGDYTLTRVWAATDECGNSTSASQTVMVADTTAPVLVGVPGDITVECNAVPAPAEVIAADNCDDPPPSVTFSEVRVDGDCPHSYTLVRTWSTTDSCGNPTSATQTITVLDTTPPTLVGVPPSVAANCDDVPEPAEVTATDACSAEPVVTFDEARFDGDCPNAYTLVRTWTASDECGNSAGASQTIIVTDETPPVLDGVPFDVAVECDAVPEPASPTATDDCDDSPVVAFEETQTPGDCPQEFSLLRTWTATDSCDNSSSDWQLVSVVDTTAPEIACPPDATGLECPADTSVTAHGEATASDNCGGVTVDSSDVSVPGCGVTETITRTWTATDDCGLDASCDQVISTVDTTPPVVTVDSTPIHAVDLDCSGDEVISLPEATADDDCDGTLPVFDDAPPAFAAGQTTTVTYSATDDCGNTGTNSLDVTVVYGANIEVTAASHTVGPGSHPGAQKEPLVGIEICAYDKSDGSCARDICGGISHHHYECIATSCPSVGCCTTDAYGQCTINLPPGDYVIISLDATKTVLPDPLGVSASDLVCGETKKKFLQQIIRADGRKIPGKSKRLTGSELLIIEPEFVVWDEVQQPYPFVFESIGEWGVTVSVTPPEGFVADYDSLSTEVNNDLASVQFTVVEVGSDLVPTQTRFQVRHNGRIKTIVSEVGITLTPDYAVSRGFDVTDLRTKNLIVDQVNGDIGKENRKRAVGMRD